MKKLSRSLISPTHKLLMLMLLVCVLGFFAYINFFVKSSVLSIDGEYDTVNSSWDVIASWDNGWSAIISWQILSWALVLTWDIISSWDIVWSGVVSSEDLVITYARKIENLISIKWQETRLDMIITMKKFISNYDQGKPLSHTMIKIMNIIKLWEVAHKIEYCTQFDDKYVLNLFGQDMNLHSTIRYSAALNQCEVNFTYPDNSVHTCYLGDSEKDLLAQMLYQKQWLDEPQSNDRFESTLEWYLGQGICVESSPVSMTITPITRDNSPSALPPESNSGE